MQTAAGLLRQTEGTQGNQSGRYLTGAFESLANDRTLPKGHRLLAKRTDPAICRDLLVVSNSKCHPY
jgi:hypothetical protein